ncbi:MAG: hypothetical protein HF976_09280 [ANME-2 cluster archaeon]|nr:hypothetical protein [ANME-2 cluster archaeon]MBC2701588.1 hypothetical protein [ANME-2 cluster archaeon]MBC2708484.1 hypothetical protein [ANME-2 cluster archaeon]MBC2748352.1 hypothetical protein [ANME-2 cluster archaeon]
MSEEIRRELVKLGIEVGDLKKMSCSGAIKVPSEVKLKRYHALLNRVSKCPEVDITPDELISSLKRKEY